MPGSENPAGEHAWVHDDDWGKDQRFSCTKCGTTMWVTPRPLLCPGADAPTTRDQLTLPGIA